MGLNFGLNYKEVWLKKLGEPIASDIEQAIEAIRAALENVVATGQSKLDPAASRKGIDVLAISSTQRSNTGSTDDPLESLIVAGNTIKVGEMLRWTVWGNSEAAGDNTSFTLKFNTTEVQATDSSAILLGWTFQTLITRTASGADVIIIVSNTQQTFSRGMFFTTSSQSFASQVSLGLKTVTNHGAGDLTIEGYLLEHLKVS